MVLLGIVLSVPGASDEGEGLAFGGPIWRGGRDWPARTVQELFCALRASFDC